MGGGKDRRRGIVLLYRRSVTLLSI